MVGGSAALGLALHPVTPMAPLVGGLLGIATGTAIGYGKPALADRARRRPRACRCFALTPRVPSR